MKSYTSIRKKSQVWSLDLMIAILIFVGALIFFYKYSINSIDIEQKDNSGLLLDAKLISSYLVSTGYPDDWTAANVTLIGLTDGEMRLDEEKVQQFSEIALMDYTMSRRLLSTSHNYYISFEDKDGNPLPINGIAGIGKDYSAENHQNLIRVVRFVFYEYRIIRLVVYVW